MSIDQQRLQELEQAFRLFNQTSLQLTEEYAKIQQALNTMAGRFSGLLNLLPAAVVVLDAQDRITVMNPAAREILGVEAAGRVWDAVVREVFAQWTVAGELKTRDGRVFQQSEATLEEEGARIVLLQDVTAARQLQEHQSRHQRLSSMGEMAASLAHQIRTPLSTALLYVSQMKPELDAQRQAQFSQRTLESLRHIEGLIKDMLQYAQGGKRADFPVSLRALLQTLQEAMQPLLQTTQSALTITWPENEPDLVVPGDQDALLTALQNLVNNAIEVVGQAAQIHIDVVREGAWVHIAVRDNGPGIPPALHEKIFEPFYTSRAQGTGLGLAVVRAVIEAHEGSVALESSPGQGSTFILKLPLTNREEQT